MPRWVVTSNVRMAVSRVHPQFLASVEGIILYLRDPVLEDPIWIQFLWYPGSDELVPMDVIRKLGCSADAKVALHISLVSVKTLTDWNEWAARLFEPIWKVAVKRLSNASPGPCNRPASLVRAASWEPNMPLWGSQSGEFEVAINNSEF